MEGIMIICNHLRQFYEYSRSVDITVNNVQFYDHCVLSKCICCYMPEMYFDFSLI